MVRSGRLIVHAPGQALAEAYAKAGRAPASTTPDASSGSVKCGAAARALVDSLPMTPFVSAPTVLSRNALSTPGETENPGGDSSRPLSETDYNRRYSSDDTELSSPDEAETPLRPEEGMPPRLASASSTAGTTAGATAATPSLALPRMLKPLPAAGGGGATAMEKMASTRRRRVSESRRHGALHSTWVLGSFKVHCTSCA